MNHLELQLLLIGWLSGNVIFFDPGTTGVWSLAYWVGDIPVWIRQSEATP